MKFSQNCFDQGIQQRILGFICLEQIRTTVTSASEDYSIIFKSVDQIQVVQEVLVVDARDHPLDHASSHAVDSQANYHTTAQVDLLQEFKECQHASIQVDLEMTVQAYPI